MLAQRFGSEHQTDEKFINEFLEIVKKYPGSCDEVWLASEYGFPELEKHRATAEKLCGVAERLRSAGLRVSLQISNTIGHGQYMAGKDCSGLVYEGSPAEHMIGPDGKAACYCFCWNGNHFQNYTVSMLEEYAKIKPYCFWIDDDLRATNHAPVEQGCFCGACMENFNKRYGSDFTCEQLAEEINYGDIRWREKHVEFVRSGLYNFTYRLSKTLCEVSPESYMGLQYGAAGGYTGYGFDFLFDAMKKGSGKNPKSRPGAGAYNDHNPNDQLVKSFAIRWQNSMLPDYVKEIRPEIENLPDVVYGKTPAGTCYETSLYLASGANAMSYAMIMQQYDPMEYHAQLFEGFANHRLYWEKLVEANENTYQAGAKLFLPKTMWKRPLGEDDAAYSWTNEPFTRGTELAYTAIPIAYGVEGDDDSVYILHGDVAQTLTGEDIEYLLTKPVFTDGASLQTLARMGYGDSFGATAMAIETAQLSERFTVHPINKGFENKDYSLSIYFQKGYAIVDKDGSTEPFGVYFTSSKNAPVLAVGSDYPYGVANAVVQTGKGAKWAVFGSHVWTDILSFDKRNQLIHAMEYIAGKSRLPAILESYQQAVVLPRENKAHKTTSVSVLNCTIGKTGELLLRVRNPQTSNFTFMSATLKQTKLFYETDGMDYLVKIPPIEAWTVGTLFCV